MTIKQFIYDTKHELQVPLGYQAKASHLYELVAAACGYGSYAALQADAILLHQTPWPSEPDYLGLAQRATTLALPNVELMAGHLSERMRTQGVSCIKVDQLLQPTTNWDDEYEWGDNEEEDEDRDEVASSMDAVQEPPSYAAQALSRLLDDDLDTPMVAQALVQLTAFAERQRPDVHWWLANLYGDPMEYQEESGTDYWYRRQQQGEVLSGAALEFAIEYEASLTYKALWLNHARKAAMGGMVTAQLALAEAGLDEEIFYVHPTKIDDPAAIAWLAETRDNPQAAHHWYNQAALRGDTSAMLELIERFDSHDLYRCWVWVLLANHLGIDFSQDNLRAIHEDGSDYDDDVGGPIYVAGREGLVLEPLPPAHADQAAHEAMGLFEALVNREL